MNGIDLSHLKDSEVRELYCAAYDLNAATLKLLRAGLIPSEGSFNLDAVMTKLEAEIKARSALHLSRSKPSLRSCPNLPPEDRIGGDF